MPLAARDAFAHGQPRQCTCIVSRSLEVGSELRNGKLDCVHLSEGYFASRGNSFAIPLVPFGGKFLIEHARTETEE